MWTCPLTCKSDQDRHFIERGLWSRWNRHNNTRGKCASCLPCWSRADCLPLGGGLFSGPWVVVPTRHAEDSEELPRLSLSSITLPSLKKELKSAKQNHTAMAKMILTRKLLMNMKSFLSVRMKCQNALWWTHPEWQLCVLLKPPIQWTCHFLLFNLYLPFWLWKGDMSDEKQPL